MIADRRLLLVQLLAHVMASHPRIVIEAVATTHRKLDDALRHRSVDLLLVGEKFLEGIARVEVGLGNDGRRAPDCIVLAEDATRPRIPGSLAAGVRAIVGMSNPFERLQRVVDELVDQRCQPDEPGGAPVNPNLTPRQLEVLRLVGAGKTSREIAAILGISLRTVETHRKHLTTRLRAKGGRLVRMATWQALASEGAKHPDALY